MAVTLTGTTGNDTLFGSTAQAALVQGQAGADRLISQYTNTSLMGNAGNDLLEIQAGDGSVVTINPGQGNDTVSISGLTTLGTLYIANGLGTSVNLGNDLFNFNTAAGAVFLQGTVRGGEGNDTAIFSNGIDGNGFKYNAGQGVDQLDVSANTAVLFANTKMGLGQGDDSATIVFNSSVIFNGMTIAGGQGSDTINFLANEDFNSSGNNLIDMGGGNDMFSAVFNPDTGFISGGLNIIGASGKDTITVSVSGTVTGAFDIGIYGDGTATTTTGYADVISFNMGNTAQDTTGMIAGGGGADTIKISANLTGATSAGFYTDGGLGNDSIVITDGGVIAGTIAGGAGNDVITFNFGSGMTAAVTANGTVRATLIGGAGNDTFRNTSVSTGGGASVAYQTTGLDVAIADFTTGDLIELLGVKVVNEDANIVRSAFVTRSILLNSSVGLTGRAMNNVAMYRDGDDVVLQITTGSGTAAAGEDQATDGSGVGIAVIRFVDNSAFGTTIDGASGALSNVGININQTLTGLKINFT
jgi:hypothetical protein